MLFLVHDPNFHVFIHASPYKIAYLITRLSEKRILDPADKRRRIPESYLHVITELEYGSDAEDAVKSAW